MEAIEEVSKDEIKRNRRSVHKNEMKAIEEVSKDEMKPIEEVSKDEMKAIEEVSKMKWN